MYYKVISNGQIVDVCDGLNYVRWQERNHLFLSCSENVADGIVSSDGTKVYLFEGKTPVDGCAFVTLGEITAEQYADIRQQLIDNGVIDDPDEPQPDDGDDNDDEGEEEQEPVAKSKLAKRVEALEAALDDMTAKDDFPQGGYFVLHDEIYRAAYPISKGSVIRPGYNCERITLTELISMKGE